jgi:hypothetical protein
VGHVNAAGGEPGRVVRRWAPRVVRSLTTVFVVVHLAALLVHNLTGGRASWASRYCLLTATSQRWGMFAPRVESRSSVPVLEITWKDGSSRAYPSEIAPPRVHLLDARRRGLANAIVSGAPGATPVREAAARRWLARVLRDEHRDATDVRQVALDRWVLEHPEPGRAARVVQVERLASFDAIGEEARLCARASESEP